MSSVPPASPREQKQSPATLLRHLNVWDAGSLVVGCVIGAGIFRLSGSVAKFSPSPFMFLLAWVLGGLLSMCGALCYAELATRFPKTGGDYVFLTQAYGRLWGFVFGWSKLFVQRTGTIAIIAFVFSEHAARVFGWPEGAVKSLAAGAIFVLTVVNVLGLTYGKTVQNIFTALKSAALILIIGAGLIAGKGSMDNFHPFWPEWSLNLISSTGLALIFVLWTYGGWTEAAYVAEEVRDPQRNLPRAIIVGLLATTALYLLVNFVYLYYIPLGEMRGTKLVAAGAMGRVWPGIGDRIVAAMVMASTFGALNGYILTGGRILYAMAKDHALFSWFGQVHPATRTPALSLCVNGALAILLVYTGALDTIVTYTEIVMYVFFAFSGISLFVFRKRLGHAPEGWRVWGYPVTPIIFIAMCFAFAINAFMEQTFWESLFGTAVASLGIPLYYLSRKLEKSKAASA